MKRYLLVVGDVESRDLVPILNRPHPEKPALTTLRLTQNEWAFRSLDPVLVVAAREMYASADQVGRGMLEGLRWALAPGSRFHFPMAAILPAQVQGVDAEGAALAAFIGSQLVTESSTVEVVAMTEAVFCDSACGRVQCWQWREQLPEAVRYYVVRAGGTLELV